MLPQSREPHFGVDGKDGPGGKVESFAASQGFESPTYPILRETIRHIVDMGSSSPSYATLVRADKERRYSILESGLVARLVPLFLPVDGLTAACKEKIGPERMEAVKSELKKALYEQITRSPDLANNDEAKRIVKADLIDRIEEATKDIKASADEQSALMAFSSLMRSVRASG